MRQVITLVLCAFLLQISDAYAKEGKVCDQRQVNAVVTKVKSRIQNTPIDSITCSQLGLFRITSGKNTFFTDMEGRFLFFGSIYDLQENREVATSYKRQQRPSRKAFSEKIAWASLPIKNAVTVGSGKKEIAVYIDVHCPYCLHEFKALQEIEGVVVHYMLGSIFGERSRSIASRILCSTTPGEALTSYMESRTLGKKGKSCKAGDSAVVAVTDFGTSKGWRGTPVTIRKSDGKVMVGFKNKESLTQFIWGE